MFDKIKRSRWVYDGAKYLVLFGSWNDDFIRYLIETELDIL